jgi:hypothetical protein
VRNHGFILTEELIPHRQIAKSQVARKQIVLKADKVLTETVIQAEVEKKLKKSSVHQHVTSHVPSKSRIWAR